MQDAEPRLDTKTITEQIISADSIPRVWKVFSDAMVSFKFDKLLYGGSRFPTQRVLGDIREALILHLGPQAYADVYLGEELYLHSPTYDWAENNNGFASWPDALRQFKGQPSPQQMRILQLNARFGIIAGYVGSLKSINLAKQRQEHPERIIQAAVKGMLPKNSLGRQMFSKLKVYAGENHPHAAQQPKELQI